MSNIKTSAECMKTVCEIGGGKPKQNPVSNILLAFLAGAYIGLGSLLAIKTAGNIPVATWGNITRLVFGGVFPVGLLLVLMAGADLFTGNCMYMPGAVLHKKAGWGGLASSWVISWVGNLLGGLAVAFFLGFLAGVLFDSAVDGSRPLAAYAVNLANAKCKLDFSTAFLRGIGCNWLVCLAIYMGLAVNDGASRVLAIWPPITAFVVLGFEHSVANMTFIPLGIFLGSSDVYLNNAVALPALTATWGAFFIDNLIPVTLGNIVGGAVFVAMIYYRSNNLKPE